MPTPSLEKAAAIAELAKKNGGVFVFATRDADLVHQENASAEIAKTPFAEFSCAECGSHVHGVKADGMTPFCVVCGHHETKLVETSKPKIPSDSELAHLSCASCGTIHAFAPELAHTIGSHLHCTACGTEMKTHADLDEMDTGLPDVDDMELVDVGDDMDEEISETTMDEPSDKASDTLTEDPVDTVTTTQDEPNAKPDEVEEDPVNPGTTQQEVIAEGEEVDVDMMDDLEGEGEGENLSFAFFGEKAAIVDVERMQILATLTPADAGENASMMQTQHFVQSVAHTIKTQGLKKACATYGFKPAKVKVKLNTVASKKVTASVEAHTKALETARAEVMEDVDHALQIAVAGFAGNFWRNQTDPLKVALLAEARAIGLKNPQQFVDRLFKEHSVASMKQVVELAKDLLKKSPESRNALAEAIDLASYQPMVTKAAEGENEADDEENDEEESAVATIATPVAEVSNAPIRPTFQSPELNQILGERKSLFK